MKHLKPVLLAKSALAAAISLTGLAAPTLSHASASQGVSCPADTEATYNNGVLKCRLPVVTSLPSVCPPLMKLATAGSDLCTLGIGPTSTSTPSSPGISVTGAVRVINPTGADTFTITNHIYFFPNGALYVGNSMNGVKCPSGFDSIRTNNGRGLRCEDTIVKKAVCDIGWAMDRRDGRDRCYIDTPFGRNYGNYTIPENAAYIGAFGDPETHGWNLDRDRSGSTDYWIREAREYRYPESI